MKTIDYHKRETAAARFWRSAAGGFFPRPGLLLVPILSLLASHSVEGNSSDYRIAPRDLLQFQIFEEPDTLLAQRVSATGELPLPMVGVVHVAGLTLREAEVKLRNLYIEGDFFIDPQVILVLREYDERSVSVLGLVNKPEQIRFPLEAESMSIVHAITLAGGLSRLARGDAIQITRIGPDDTETRFVVNVENYLAGRRDKGAENASFQLLPGDIVFVPERSF